MDLAKLAAIYQHIHQKNYDAAIALFDEVLADPQLEPQVVQVFAQERSAVSMVRDIRIQLKDTVPETALPCDWHQSIKVQPGTANVVFFHVNWSGKHPFLDGDRIDYKAALDSAIAAARRAIPGCAAIVLTDSATDLSSLDAQVVTLPIMASQMMYSRVRAYRSLVQSKQLRGPTLFLDTDVLLNRNFLPLFDGSFDVGLTYRTEPVMWHMPYNEGLILASDGSSQATLALFTEALAIYDRLAGMPSVERHYGFDVRMWRGGQLSLAALLDWHYANGGIQDVVRSKTRYRLLPCDQFNYAVKTGDAQHTTREKWALHFKGAGAKNLIPRL